MLHRTDARANRGDPATPVSRPAGAVAQSALGSLLLRDASPVAILAATATAVAVVDLATKQVASFVLGTRGAVSLPLIRHAVRLTVVLNDQSAFGISLGPYTWQINLVLTTVALLLCLSLCRALAVIDEWAPLMLGLITGAATGNLVSLISSPEGVPDFIAVHSWNGHELVFNFADVAAVMGVALLIRTTWTVGRALRARE
jgi:signal peptidase II